MNRRNLLLSTAAVSLAAFAGGAYWVNQRNADAAKLEAETQAKLAAENTELVRPHSPILGNPNAPVTIVEFFDPSCEACRAFHPIVKGLLEEYGDKVRVVLRYTALHQGSDEAVRILETARLQNVFEPVLTAILDRQPEWAKHEGPDLDVAWQIAESAGLDVTKAKIDRMQPNIVSVLNKDAADVQAVGIEKTPTFFVNGKPLTEFGPDGLKALIQAEIDAL
jgi:protein-disulfide isomerase